MLTIFTLYRYLHSLYRAVFAWKHRQCLGAGLFVRENVTNTIHFACCSGWLCGETSPRSCFKGRGDVLRSIKQTKQFKLTNKLFFQLINQSTINERYES
jgi:hypothetical protein